MKKYMAVLLVLSFSVWGKGSDEVDTFSEAKKVAAKIHKGHETTIYCGCKYSGKVIDLKSCGYKVQNDAKRAARLEWEHVVPAEAFGNSFKEWREGTSACVKKGKQFKGRKCAGTNPEFARMEADLYNLWPEIGELNGLRSNYSMAALTRSDYDFGGCKAKLQDRKFEPMDMAKGIVARTYMYMDGAYPNRGIISDKNKKLFEAWDKMYPVTPWECERAKLIASIQKNRNEILHTKCAK